MTTTPTPRPVPTTEDRMRDAATPARPAMTFREARDAGLLPPAVALALPQDSDAGIDPTDRSFAAYLTAQERDQLDARAATAEAERDEALNDRDAYREARDLLRQQLDAMKAAKKRALGRLEKAEHVIDLIRDGQEQIDRALAAYDTTPGEPAEREDTPHEDPARLRGQLAEAHADCARYATERDEARAALANPLRKAAEHLRLLAEDHAADSLGFGIGWAADALDAWANNPDEDDATPVLGSPADRAQDEQAGLPAWVLDLVRGLDRYEVEHPKLFRYIRPGVYEPWDCPAPLLALVPAEVRRLVELPAQVGASAEREG